MTDTDPAQAHVCPMHGEQPSAHMPTLPRFADVGWILDTDSAQLIWFEPKRVKTIKPERMHAKSLARCPAVLDNDSRLFEVLCPFDLEIGFRRDKDGKFLWPGYGENMRVLKWIVERSRGMVNAKQTALGWVPRFEDLDWGDNHEVSRAAFEELAAIDAAAWHVELEQHGEWFDKLKPRMPQQLMLKRDLFSLALDD